MEQDSLVSVLQPSPGSGVRRGAAPRPGPAAKAAPRVSEAVAAQARHLQRAAER